MVSVMGATKRSETRCEVISVRLIRLEPNRALLPLADVGFCADQPACAMLETAMNIVLYYAPNACSLVPYITLTKRTLHSGAA